MAEELSELLEEVRRIDVLSKRLVTDVMAGHYSSVFRGSGVEFDRVREYVETSSFVAPLPLFGVIFDYDLSSRWALSTAVEASYLPVGSITGAALRTNILGRYAINGTVGISFGLRYFDIQVEEEDDKSISEIKYRYDGFFAGVQLVF